MGLCHAAVQRCVPEAMGLTPLWPGTEELIPALDPPVQADMVVLYADDGVIAGHQREILRLAAHLRA